MHVAVETVLKNASNSIYKLTILAGRRAVELAEGNPQLVEGGDPHQRPISLALREIASGKVICKEVK